LATEKKSSNYLGLAWASDKTKIKQGTLRAGRPDEFVKKIAQNVAQPIYGKI
jgi:hypothetical protein